MKINCSHCSKKYNIPDERLSKFGTKMSFPCPSCKEIIEIIMDAKHPIKAQSTDKGLMTGDKLKKSIMRTVSDLPPMPQVAQKARKITADEKSSFKDLAKVIETDQAIATRVLKLANSSFYGQAGNVTSLKQASVVLGMKTLNELLTLACAGSLLGPKLKGYGLDSGDLWMHSLATAGCAKMIAEKKYPSLTDDAFSAALIHDCGKLILDKYILERLGQFGTEIDEGKPFLKIEQNMLGFDHAQIAAEVCEKWQIPKNITNAILYHHNPAAARDNELVNIVHAADGIALMSGIGAGIDGMLYEVDDRVMEFLGISEEDIGIYILEISEYVEQTAAAL